MLLWKKDKNTYSPVTGSHSGPLPAGVYTSYTNMNGERIFYMYETNMDATYELPGLPVDFILSQLATFWEKTAEYKKYGFLQKRGIMLYGPPGCGKSSIVGLIRKKLLDMNGIVFVPMSGTGFSGLSASVAAFRELEPDRPVMTLVEDIETLLESSNGSLVAESEKAALALYDGENQINNVVHIATTNKPDAVADRFIRRPGRFDVVVGIHNPSRETREAYLVKVCNGHLTLEQKNHILDNTEGLSLAYMREIASTFLVLELSLEETITRLNKQSKAKYKHTSKTGFTIGFNENEE
jgi:SpoVK/Ycf46/Vps4 family AAA+-type ATPase